MDDAMSDQNPQTRTLPMTEVKQTLSHLIEEVQRGNTRVLIEKAGIPEAALVSVGDLDRLSQLDQERAERWQLLEAMREPFRGVPTEEIDREAAKAIAEVRAERRAAREASVKSA
jgi:prevent-host-death family protein